MKSYRDLKKKRIQSKYLLAVLTVVCIVVIFTSLVFGISGGPLSDAAGYVFVPMQDGINSAGLWLSDKVNDFRTLSAVLEENEQLQAQVDDLTSQLNNIKLQQYDIEQYEQLLALDEEYSEYDKIAASVIASDTSNWFSTFTINKGKADGIDVGMNVISGSGLVGLVTDVGQNYAKVRSIIDDSSNVSAMVLTTKDNFNVSGSLQSMNESKLLPFSQLSDEDDRVSLGDPVVTSYVSDQYWQGLLIGYIYEIEDDPNNLTKSGTITPVVDFKHLQNVLVITAIKDTGEDDISTSD